MTPLSSMWVKWVAGSNLVSTTPTTRCEQLRTRVLRLVGYVSSNVHCHSALASSSSKVTISGS